MMTFMQSFVCERASYSAKVRCCAEYDYKTHDYACSVTLTYCGMIVAMEDRRFRSPDAFGAWLFELDMHPTLDGKETRFESLCRLAQRLYADKCKMAMAS